MQNGNGNQDNAAIQNQIRKLSVNDLKTEIGISLDETDINCNEDGVKSIKRNKLQFALSGSSAHLVTLFILGALLWGLAWSAWGAGWNYNGHWFRMAIVAAIAWTSGLILNNLTTLPPLLAALFVGILARHLEYLDMRYHEDVDSFLRKVYPVVILGKASLGWDLSFMRTHWKRVSTLGVLPWFAEVLTVATITNYLLDFPIIWGLLLGTIYSSGSCAVVLPSVNKGAGLAVSERNWPQLVCTAGGIDTTLSVGVYGLIFAYMFYSTNNSYRIAKTILTLLVGVSLGICWGTIAKYVPNKNDFYVAELRVLFVLLGGLFCNFFTSATGWNGAGGVAVLACNMTAAHHWKSLGWPLNKNPASTAYRVLWAALEPTLFAFTGTFFVINQETLNTVILGFGVLAVCLFVRLLTAAIVCWDFKIKEKLYLCFTWTPKSIVEAVLCPVALTAAKVVNSDLNGNAKYGEDIIRLIVQAIIITTPLAFLLTHYLGPKLLIKK